MLRRLALFGIAVFLSACSDGPGPVSDACPQTYEFGNLGCARVQGVVRDAGGNPVAGARLTMFPPEGTPNLYDTPMDDTEADGSYSLEIHDHGGPDLAPSPVPMYLYAALLGDVGPIAPDSHLVNLEFAPVGEVPEVLQADITLNLP